MLDDGGQGGWAVQSDRQGALGRLRVLDLSRILAGPWSAQLLADLGADVIKVERPRSGDDTRGWGPPYLADAEGIPTRESAYYLAANRNKRSVTVDIASPDGQEIIRRLAAGADVVIENFKVGGLASYRLDYESLRSINPRLIYCSITGFGQTGPYATRAGYDVLIQAMGGLMSITGSKADEPGGGPQKVGVAVVDILTGLYGTVGILAALAHRDVTGEGQHIDVALLDVEVACLANQAMNYLVSGDSPKPMGNAHPNIVPYQDFPTLNGAMIVAVGSDAQFARLWELLGFARDPRFATNSGRVAARAEVVSRIGGATVSRTTSEWVAALEAIGVPCGPINTLADVFADPQIVSRGMRVDLPHPVAGSTPLVANPLRLSTTPIVYRLSPPTLGQHNDAILSEGLGLGPRMVKLVQEGVI
ncbi:CaiB/BaiF CoA-transferase family protein [Sphingomonas sp. UYEF23]|uniref:CaiB/BaiF CoA transferase family protein n=1 Tax=Sphingomonas sp. UYEF23 TaxID=1756408 RepID=UPI00339907F6